MFGTFWTTAIVALARVALEVGGGSSGGLVINLLDMQWWQALVALLVALGLSPAPWILGLATGKIQFTTNADAAHQRELDAREKAYAEQLEQLERYHVAVVGQRDERYADLAKANERNIEVAEQQKARGDKLEDALAQSTETISMNNHILLELKRSAEEVTPGG